MADLTTQSFMDTFLAAANVSAARTELALGAAALLAVGTTTGTVAAGDDARFTDARTPLTHTHIATSISDSTSVGRAVLTAASVTAARLATESFGTSVYTMSRDAVVGLDMMSGATWTIGNVPAGSFPLLSVYKIINNSTTTPTAGDHSVSLITLAEDATGAKMNMLAGESRVNARGIGNYTGHNSKFTYQQFGSQVPANNGIDTAAHWADVLINQSDNVTPLTTTGLYATCYLASAVVGGDPLLRYSYRGYDRFKTHSTTNGTSTDAAILAPLGGIMCGLNLYVGGNITAEGNGSFGGTVVAAQSVNNIYAGLSSNNTNTGSSAAACFAITSDAGTTYLGRGSAAFATVPNTAGKFFVYDTSGIVLTGSTTAVDALITGTGTMGAAAQVWRMGQVRSATVVMSTSTYVEVEINGTVRKLAIVT